MDYQLRYGGFPLRQKRAPEGWYVPVVHQRRCSPSLYRAQKVKRDRARMTAFILRKTAENMPFADLDNSEIVRLRTNNSLCPKISSLKTTATTTASTQTTESVDPGDYETLKTENVRLDRENAELDAAVLDLKQLNDRIREFMRVLHDIQNSRQLKLINQIDSLESQCREHKKADSSGMLLHTIEMLQNSNFELENELSTARSKLKEQEDGMNIINEQLTELMNSQYERQGLVHQPQEQAGYQPIQQQQQHQQLQLNYHPQEQPIYHPVQQQMPYAEYAPPTRQRRGRRRGQWNY